MLIIGEFRHLKYQLSTGFWAFEPWNLRQSHKPQGPKPQNPVV